METKTGVWIDSSKAIIVKLTANNENVTEIESGIENKNHHENDGDKGSFMGSRHINNEKKFEERKSHQTDTFLKKVVDNIKNDDEFYVFGPAQMKLKLKHEIEQDIKLNAKLRMLEAADSMTLKQVVANVKSFYAKVI